MADKKRRVIEFHVPGLAPKEEPPNTDPTKGFVAPPPEKKPAVQRVPEHIREAFGPEEKEPLPLFQIGETDRGYPMDIETPNPSPRHPRSYGPWRETVNREVRIPRNSDSYSNTAILGEELPPKVARHFAKMELDSRGGNQRMADAYEADIMGGLGLLRDDYPEHDQTRENAERLLWKLPLKGGPQQQPTRKKMIRRSVR
jgi:hypothetical protein